MKQNKSDRIVIFQRIVPHYRAGFFKKFIHNFPDTKIFYGQPYKNESLRNADGLNETDFISCKNFYLNKSGKIFFSKIYSKLRQLRPGIIISVFNVGNLNIYVLLFLRKLLKFKLILWSFGYDPERGFDPNNSFADKVRLYLSQKADAVIFYWEKGRQEVAQYSLKKDHYFIAPNTLDTEKQIKLKESFDKTGTDKLKSELGVKEKFHFIYIGRLIKDKQVEILLNAFRIIENENTDCRLTIIGDGPEKENLIKLSDDLKLNNVHFKGEILDEEQTGEWIYISDAFVMPGRLGLSVVHSFCFGTPVISQKKEKYFHGEGIGYIKEGINGFLADDGNINDMADIMSKIISDPELSEKLRLGALETAKNDCSIEKMLGGFEKAIKYVQTVNKN